MVSAAPEREFAAQVVRDFLAQWRNAWMASATERGDGISATQLRAFMAASVGVAAASGATTPDSVLATRMVAVHCHVNGSYDSDRLVFLRFAKPVAVIQAGQTPHGVCPFWRMSDVDPPGDELIDIDAALTDTWRRSISASRRQLVAILDSLAHVAPQDDFIAGQRLRFALALDDSSRTLAAVRECAGTPWWCVSLAGLAASRLGHWSTADSVFAVAEAMMSPEARCAWLDVGSLLPASSRREYVAMPCARRLTVGERLWWLADPLMSTEGNSRRVVHRARLMLVLLHAALAEDERYHWAPDAGGAVLREVIIRYGWPSAAWWPGAATDSGHSIYLREIGTSATRPYSSFEYGRNRVHLLPSWRALSDPFSAPSTELTAARPPADLRSTWWPSEHAAIPEELCELGDAQVAILRRQTSIRVASAFPVRCSGVPATVAQAYTAAIVLSPGPDAPSVIGRSQAMAGGVARVTVESDARPVVVSLEAVGAVAHGAPAMRMRFGALLPADLSVMRRGSIAISMPLLFDGSGERPDDPGSTRSVRDVPQEADAAIARMLGSQRIGRLKQLGIFWETYNVATSDSLEVRVDIERAGAVEPWRRLANSLGIVDDARSATSVAWREFQAPTTMGSGRDAVPIRPRGIVMDVSTLKPGDYWVRVVVGRPNERPISSQRLFSNP
jgi:hypothetical protein